MARAGMFQDNGRETVTGDLLGLRLSGKRNKVDAEDQHGNWFELKSTSTTQVTTGRDISVKTIKEKWRKMYWIVAKGRQKRGGKFEISALFVVHPDDLDEWFSKEEEELLKKEVIFMRVLAYAKRAGAPAADIDKTTAICKRGITPNNHKIPLRLFSQRGVQLDHQNPTNARQQLALFVQRRPLSRRRRRPPRQTI
jgi:Restriction endonuclease PvuII